MRLPLDWLKEFVPVRLNPAKLAEALTVSGSEVEKIETQAEVTGIVVGEVLAAVKHPNADRLKVCEVRLVNDQAPRQIVCGAPNVAAGQKVCVALPGTVLANGLELKKANIRGVESDGMICARDELGLGADHSGIIVLPAEAEVGEPAAKWLPKPKIVLELDITPNRGDCLSIRGMAREVAAITGTALKIQKFRLSEAPERNNLKVKIQNLKDCPQYVARVVTGIKVGDSPEHIQARLLACGVRPINAVVDATNYVMLELGQPMHAFDAEKVKTILVRRAKANEKIKTLDGQNRNLQVSDIVITDGKKSLAIAGIMGGAETEVSRNTQKIILESARFDPVKIRLTANRLGLRSEASNRFEKGLDPALALEAADRVCELITAWCGGKILKGRSIAGQKRLPKPKPIVLELAYVNRMLGVKVSIKAAKQKLEALQCQVLISGQRFKVTPPSFRLDLLAPIDLVEEIGRLMNYNTFPLSLPAIPQKLKIVPVNLSVSSFTRKRLLAAGFTEVATYSFYSQKTASDFDLADQTHLSVANPLNPDQALLRRSIMPQLLEIAGRAGITRDSVKIFEIGKVFWPSEQNRKLPDEPIMLGLVCVQKQPEPYLVIKGVLEDLLASFNFRDVRIHQSTQTSARLVIANEPIGIIGRVGEKYAKLVKLKKPATFAEIDLSQLALAQRTPKRIKSLPVYPAVTRDLAFALPKSVPHAELVRVIRQIDPLILSVRGFDRYKLPNGLLSAALKITFQSPGKTLTNEEVQRIVDKIAEEMQKNFGAELRS
ncbi:phenylalanine--tRNA ligase subunit beta [Candidatus Parcubacteria bacterium]|jgi:phenylalanyl-tRNA synthetase beta chain|nr:MAG: phenylalanine--tRNA ligase subunit beta [Candidatus Parcubacteria bacterium]